MQIQIAPYVRRTYLLGAPNVIVCGEAQLPPYGVRVVAVEPS